MAWGNIFGKLNQGDLDSALSRANPYGESGARALGGGSWNPGQPLVQNGTQLSDDDVRRAIATSNGMKAAAEANPAYGGSGPAQQGKPQGGGVLGKVMGGAGALGGGGAQAPQAPAGNPYAQARDLGDENQQEAFGKLGSLIGAVGSFYTGNYAGMASSIKGLSG